MPVQRIVYRLRLLQHDVTVGVGLLLNGIKQPVKERAHDGVLFAGWIRPEGRHIIKQNMRTYQNRRNKSFLREFIVDIALEKTRELFYRLTPVVTGALRAAVIVQRPHGGVQVIEHTTYLTAYRVAGFRGEVTDVSGLLTTKVVVDGVEPFMSQRADTFHACQVDNLLV